MTLAITERGVAEAFAAAGRADRYERWWARSREALGYWPESWFVDGQVVIEATETPATPWGRRIATVALPHTIQWRPRFVGFATRGITAHEAAHLFQLQPGPGRDALRTLRISRFDQLRLSYNGTLLEGIPYLIQRAMGTRPGWERLRDREPPVAAALLTWFVAHTIRGPEWIAEEFDMTSAPDLPADFPFPTFWEPAHPSNYWPRPHYQRGRTEVKGLCFHTPEEPADDRESTPIYFANPAANASTHFYVSDDGATYQMVLETDFPWAQGTRSVDAVLPRPTYFSVAGDISYNAIFLSVEVEGYAISIGRTMFEGSPQFEAVAQWAALECDRYNIPIDRAHLVGHSELNKRKGDPGAGFPWTDLLQRIRAIANPEPDLGVFARLDALEAAHAAHYHDFEIPGVNLSSSGPKSSG